MEHASKLADSNHLVLGQIGDGGLADDGRHVVLAMRLERDRLQQNDLVIAADLLEGPVEVHRRVLGIALGIFAPGTSDAPRGVEQALTVGIVAGPANERSDRLFHVLGDLGLLRGLDEIPVFGLTMKERRVHFASSFWMSSATSAACSRISGTATISQ